MPEDDFFTRKSPPPKATDSIEDLVERAENVIPDRALVKSQVLDIYEDDTMLVFIECLNKHALVLIESELSVPIKRFEVLHVARRRSTNARYGHEWVL